jgi:DNA-binding transcriptional regulator YiaG
VSRGGLDERGTLLRMSTDQAATRRTLEQMREGLAAFYAQVAATIDRLGESDPQAAFTLATAHQLALRDLHDQEETRASRLRARQAMRIREREALSLAGLADRIGVSKSRAEQLVNLARPPAPAPEPEEATP